MAKTLEKIIMEAEDDVDTEKEDDDDEEDEYVDVGKNNADDANFGKGHDVDELWKG